VQVAQGGSSQNNQAGQITTANAAPSAQFQNLLPGTIDNTNAGLGAPLPDMSLDNGTQVIPAAGAAGNQEVNLYIGRKNFL
jgi:hypothetical protein